jgi:hypothetical protein
MPELDDGDEYQVVILPHQRGAFERWVARRGWERFRIPADPDDLPPYGLRPRWLRDRLRLRRAAAPNLRSPDEYVVVILNHQRAPFQRWVARSGWEEYHISSDPDDLPTFGLRSSPMHGGPAGFKRQRPSSWWDAVTRPFRT